MFARLANAIPALALALLCFHAGAAVPTQEISASVVKPPGDGPFPAIVMMHDCSGLGPRSSGAPVRWAEELARQGYVVIIPDSFTPRGFAGGVCLIPGKESTRVNGNVRAADAYSALESVRALPYVDGKRVGLMGGSHGGWATLAAMSFPLDTDDALAGAKRDGFAAAIALYPSCSPQYGAWSTARRGTFGPVTSYSGVYRPTAPLLILTGEKDDWTPAEPCRQMAERSRAAGFPVDIKIYPDTHHSFDNDRPVRHDPQRNNPNAPSGRGATTGGNPEAWMDARKRVSEFFAQHLGRRP